MPIVTLNAADVANAQLGINLPVLLGYVRGQGNEILNHALTNKNRVVARILGEGEMDGIERLFINGTKANHADTNLVHFHPGTDGVLGVGLTPVSTGRPPGAVSGNQIVNGDGETGTIGVQAPGWTVFPGNNNLVVANDFSHSGNNSLKVVNGSPADSASYQDISVVNGGTYRLQGWIKTTAITTSAGHGALLNVDVLSGVSAFTIISKSGSDFAAAQPDVGIFADGNAHGFTLVSCVFRVTGSGTLRVYCQLGYGANLAGTAWFDDVQLYLAEQDVDSFWSLLPANFQPTTFSRKAYLMMNVPPDPAAPSATLTVMADYRGLRLRQFDGSGNQTGYAFSTNGAEQCLELILRTMLNPEWNTSPAAAPGGDLVAAQKARINWTSLADAVSWCNTLLANGQKRFESSLAIVQQTSLLDALTQLCMMSQLYITEAAGQIYICPDKPRASTFILTSDHIVVGTAEFDKIDLHGANNRFIASYNDLNAQGMADIDIPGNSGLLRSGTGTVTVQIKTTHPFTLGQNVQIVPPQDGTTHDSGFDGVFPVATIPAANKFTYAQSGNANWLLWSEQFDRLAWQKQTNITVTPNNQVDPLGGNTADTISSGVTAGQAILQPTSLISTSGVQYTFSVWLKAAANTPATIGMSRVLAGVGNDGESAAITVTNAWQRFTFTHSGTWTGAQSVQPFIIITNASSSIFAWGAQLEDGPIATLYRQTSGENYLLWSERFNNAAWQLQTAITVAPDNQTDPLGGNTADTVSSGATAGQAIFQTSPLLSVNGIQVTFSVWLKAAGNTAVTLRINRGGVDGEDTNITVTNVWQRFTATHSAAWTGSTAINAIIVMPVSSSIFAWGAQLENGAAANTYIQTTDIVGGTSGARSGNGTVGTPESRFAVRSPVVDHEQHQNAIGQRGLALTPIFRVSPISLNFGNNVDERVRRALNFIRARKLGIPATPYIAPMRGKITCLMDAVDLSQAGNPRALISQLCGDIITVDPTVSEEYQGDYEIEKAVYTLPGTDGGSSSSSQSNQPTIDLTLLQYLAGAFSDTSLVAQAIRASIPSALVPIAAVDSNGVQRLAGSFRNNPVNSNGILTGTSPLSQSGGTPTILVASSTIQFGDGQVSYNSGSVNPGSLGKWTVYTIDPNFIGGAVIYLATQSMHIKTSDNGIVIIGTIDTVIGGGATGTGGGTGAGDGSGGNDVLPTR